MCALFLLAYLFIYPVFKHATEKAVASSGMQCTATIEHALFDYSYEHPEEFAKAKSSTEVFQNLIDEKYVDDAAIFHYPLPGKIRPAHDAKKLLPENVGFDITYPFTDQTPEETPIVYLSGYAITYQAGAKAVPIKVPPSWTAWWEGQHPPYILVCTKFGKVSLLQADLDGSIPNFIPADFDPKGKTYRQLTPDGELPL